MPGLQVITCSNRRPASGGSSIICTYLFIQLAIKAYEIKQKTIWLHFKQNKITQNFNLYERASVVAVWRGGGNFLFSIFYFSSSFACLLAWLFFRPFLFQFGALLLNQSARRRRRGSSNSSSHKCIAEPPNDEWATRGERDSAGWRGQSIPFSTK